MRFRLRAPKARLQNAEYGERFGSILEALQKSDGWETCFPTGSVKRIIWDDQMQNWKKKAEGKSSRAFRYHPVTIKWALRRLIKDGETSYNETRDVWSGAREFSPSLRQPDSTMSIVSVGHGHPLRALPTGVQERLQRQGGHPGRRPQGDEGALRPQRALRGGPADRDVARRAPSPMTSTTAFS